MKQTITDQNNDGGRKRPLRVAFLCNSDILGGAAIVTRRLVQALNEEGVDAHLVVFNKLSDDERVVGINAGRAHRGWVFLLERLRIAMANGFSRDNLFKVSIASHGLSVANNPEVRQADVIVLSWINQGMLSLKEIERLGRLGKPIVWIMHDMWNLTGICHHAMECRGYLKQCGNCQFLSGAKAADLSHKIWLKKKRLYDKVPMTFVAVSNWLAQCCKKSELLGERDIRVIPNAFPVHSFVTQPHLPIPAIPADRKVIIMGAARLDDPIKGFDMAIAGLNRLFDNHPDVARRAIAVFFGNIRQYSSLDNLRFPHIELGTINDGNYLRELYARASVVLSTSLYETLPGTLIEGQAAGALPVTFGRGGQSDIVDHKVNGYIARYKDTDDIAEGILWALNQEYDREALHRLVAERFSAKTIANRFIDLFDELLEGAGKKS